jgi:hypothetical protein
MRKSLVAAVTALLAFGAANPAGATPVNKNFTVNVDIEASLLIEALDCSNGGGHYISIGGSQSGMPKIHGRATFRSPSNKWDFSATDEVYLDAGPTTYIDKRGVGGGVGGNPWIYIAGDGESPALLGRCVQGFRANWSHRKTVTIPISTLSSALECSSKGSSLESKPQAGGASQGVTFTFDNKAPDNPSAPRPHRDATTVNFTLSAAAGMAYTGRHKGIGGNPDVYLNLGVDAPTADGVYLGRCRSLM